MGKLVARPSAYYEDNLNGIFVLLNVMTKHVRKSIIFNFSATLDGEPDVIPMTEGSPGSTEQIPTAGPYG